MVYFKSKENITKENFNDFDKVQKNVNKFISETTHDSYSGCIIVDINNRKLIQQWGDYDDCKKQALKDKFMISDLEEDLHLRNKHTSPSGYFLKSLSELEIQFFERQFVLLQRYQEFECNDLEAELHDHKGQSSQHLQQLALK